MAKYPLLDVESEAAAKYLTRKVEVYQQDRTVLTRTGEPLYDWRRKATNGKIVATSGTQGYARLSGAIEAATIENPGLSITVVES